MSKNHMYKGESRKVWCIFFFATVLNWVTEPINRKSHSRLGVGVENRLLLRTIGIAINKILSITTPTIHVEKLNSSTEQE